MSGVLLKNLIAVGETYKLRHQRFGIATIVVMGNRGEWLDVLIKEGRLIGMSDQWGVGETKTVRVSHCVFTKED